MINLSWEYEFRGNAAAWVVSVMFLAVAGICGFAAPALIQPTWHGEAVAAQVSALDRNEDGESPVFAYGSSTWTSSVRSSRSAYAVGDHVVLIQDPANADAWYVQNDKDAAVAIVIVRVLAGVFGLIGAAVLAMLLAKWDEKKVSLIGGVLGALSFAVPATVALPGLAIAYQQRPNIFFAAQDEWGMGQWLLGGLFTVLGIATLVGTFFLYRYQTRTGEEGWSWHWER